MLQEKKTLSLVLHNMEHSCRKEVGENEKSVLVIDTPEHGCISCLIGRNHSNSLETCIYCPIAGKCVLDKEAETIPDWCPLKPLPEKKSISFQLTM